MLIAEQVVGMNLGAEDEFNAGQIARTEVELLVELAAALNQEGGLASLEFVERGAEELGLGLGNLEGLDNCDFAISDLRGDSRRTCPGGAPCPRRCWCEHR